MVPELTGLSSSPLWPKCLSGGAETSRTGGSKVHEAVLSKLACFGTTENPVVRKRK